MSDRPRGRAHGGQGGAEPRARIRLRELQVMEQILLGRSQHQIALSLGITQPAVSKIVKRIEERLLADVSYQAERQRARQTLQLGYLYREGIDAWQASKQDAVRRRQRRADGAGAGGTVTELVAENQHGDPRFLEVARKALGDVRTLWGINAPERIAAVTTFHAMSDAALEQELQRQLQLLQPSILEHAPSSRASAEPRGGGA